MALIIVLFIDVALSSGEYDFQDAYSDASAIRDFFAGRNTESNAAVAYDCLYDFIFKNEEDYILNKVKGNSICEVIKVSPK